MYVLVQDSKANNDNGNSSDSYIFEVCSMVYITGYPILFGGLVAVATYQSFYPVCLLVPGIISLVQERNSTSALLKPLLSFAASLGLLMMLSAEVTGSWEFLEATYGFM